MRGLVCLALLALPAVTLESQAQEKKDARTLWVYEGGWFAKSKDGSWYEMNETIFRKNGKPTKYGEAKRTNDFIDLFDDATRKYVRLNAKHGEILTKKGDWEKFTAGSWKAPE